MNTPSALDIRDAFHEAGGAPYLLSTVEGIDVTDTCYINCCPLIIDRDYRMFFLLEVCDRDRENNEVWVSYLFLAHEGGGLTGWETAWHEDRPHRFFDRSVGVHKYMAWAVQMAEGTEERWAERDRARLSPEQIDHLDRLERT